MISREELQNLCVDRLEDARILYEAGRYDGAFYLCGYIIELGLKRKICETLGWEGFPNSKKEFENMGSFRTHNLEVLLHLSGIKNQVKEYFFSEWSVVTFWDPEIRYSRIQTEERARSMLLASRKILEIL
jgi:hypothetical protein